MQNKEKRPETYENTWEGVEKFFAAEVIDQAKRNAKRWFIAWIITMAALFATNVYWIYVFNSYEYVSQDGSGINSINTGNQEDINYGTEDEN